MRTREEVTFQEYNKDESLRAIAARKAAGWEFVGFLREWRTIILVFEREVIEATTATSLTISHEEKHGKMATT